MAVSSLGYEVRERLHSRLAWQIRIVGEADGVVDMGPLGRSACSTATM